MTYLTEAQSRRPVKSAPTSARTKAFDLIKEKSFSRGRFVLASGKTSDYYLDLKPTMFDPEGGFLLAQLLLAHLERFSVEAVGGLAVGAVPLVATVAMRSWMGDRPLPGFFVRQSVKDHGTKRMIEGTAGIAGKRVAILDDVTTTGESAMVAANAAKAAGATVALVLAVVDRQEGAEEFFKKAAIPFQWLFRASEFIRA
jgi:orotate phosphoribosyltransferase